MNTWRRLLPASEVTDVKIPTPQVRSEDTRARHYEEGATAIEGRGLAARMQVTLGLPSGVDPGGAGFLAAGDPVGDAPRKLYATADRTWWFSEMSLIESCAQTILLGHDFPATLDAENVAWAWDGVNLNWAEKPAATAAEVVAWDGFILRPAYREGWPEWSPFDWAERVWKCRRLRLLAASSGGTELALSAGFDLGIFLGLWAGRKQYDAMVHRGGLRASWSAPALAEAQRLRKINPLLSQPDLVAKLRTSGIPAVENFPGDEQMRKTIAKWEKAGTLPRSSKNLALRAAT